MNKIVVSVGIAILVGALGGFVIRSAINPPLLLNQTAEQGAAPTRAESLKRNGVKIAAQAPRSQKVLGSDAQEGGEFFSPLPISTGPPPARKMAALLDQEFNLSSQAIQKAFLNPEETAALQGLLKELKHDLVQVVKSKSAVDPDGTDEENGVYAFKIEAFPEEGLAVLNAFHQKSTELLGQSRAKATSGLLDRSGFFGSFGSHEILVKFQEVEYGDGTTMAARWEERNPATGKRIMHVSGGIELFEKKFGKIVEIENTGEPNNR